MNAERVEAFDKFASKQSAHECNRWIEELMTIHTEVRGLKPSQREELLDDLSGWIRHYRIKTFNFRQGE